jgi:hypothetical protein
MPVRRANGSHPQDALVRQLAAAFRFKGASKLAHSKGLNSRKPYAKELLTRYTSFSRSFHRNALLQLLGPVEDDVDFAWPAASRCISSGHFYHKEALAIGVDVPWSA